MTQQFSTFYVKKQKRPAGTGLWRAYEVADDEFGTWLFTPKGSRYRGEKDGTVGYLEVGQGTRDAGLDVLHLAPKQGWWFAAWYVLDGETNLTIDICLPMTCVDGEWTYVDLELDLWKSSDGTQGLMDEDEFDEAVTAGWISDSERRESLAAAADLQNRLVCGDVLFDSDGWEYYRAALALELPPLTTLGSRE